jgi:hypothetical protein
MFDKHRACRDTIAALRAENSDLRSQVRFLTQAAHDRESGLIDRILAISHPAAHREIHPLPPRSPKPDNGEARPQRVWFPGTGMTPPPAPRPVVAGTDKLPPPEAEPDEVA